MRVAILFLLIMAVGHAETGLERFQKECRQGTNARIILKHREHNGVGYSLGYTTLGIFMAPKNPSSVMPFLDLRGHRFTDNRYAANAGLGVRIRNADDSYVFGANVYYDFRESDWIHPQQIGAGFEILSDWVDFRANGYYPFSQKKATEFTTDFAGFFGNGAMLKKRFRAALSTVELEFGFPIGTPVDLYFALGPYYLFKRIGPNVDCGNVLGGKARMTAQLFDGVSAGIEGTYDGEFHGTFQGYLALNFPIGPATMRKKGGRWKSWYKQAYCSEYAQVVARQTQDVIRNEIIPICKATGTEAASLDRTIIFVDNDNPLDGNGTFENPYMTLALAQGNSSPNDIIYVFPGSDAYEEGFVFQQAQLLQSSAKDLNVGDVFIPAQTPGILPVISNPFGPGIVLASQGSVVGFEISNSSTFGVVLDAISSGSVICNMITESGLTGITGTDFTGSIVISENTIADNGNGRGIDFAPGDSTIQILSNTIREEAGLFVIPNGLTAITVSGNMFVNNEVIAMGLGNVSPFPGSFTNVVITNNQGNDSFITIQYFNNLSGQVYVANNSFFNLTTTRIGQMSFDSSDVMLFEQNSLNLPFGDLFPHTSFDLRNNANFTLRNNFFNTSSTRSVSFGLHGGGSTSVSLLQNAISELSGIGLFFEDDAGTDYSLLVEENSITAPGSDAVLFNLAGGGSTGSISVLRNEITNSGANGLTIVDETGTNSNSFIEQNNINADAFGIDYSIAGTHRSEMLGNSVTVTGLTRMRVRDLSGNLCIEVQNNIADPMAASFQFLADTGIFIRIATNTGDFLTSNNTGDPIFTGFIEEVVAPLPPGCSPP